MKKCIGIGLLVALLAACGQTQPSALEEAPKVEQSRSESWFSEANRRFPSTYGTTEYARHNLDVARACGVGGWGPIPDASVNCLARHFLTAGIWEGRQARDMFHADFYRNYHGDLQGLNRLQLHEHFNAYGRREGRIGSLCDGRAWVFDLYAYWSRYGDLRALVDRGLLCPHFMIYGIWEGRQASYKFNFGAYRHFNPDLARLNNLQLANHYARYGRLEGRVATWPRGGALP